MVVMTEKTYIVSEGDVSLRFAGRGQNLTIEMFVDSRHEATNAEALVGALAVPISDLENIIQKIRHDERVV